MVGLVGVLSANTVAQCRRAPLTDQSAPVVHVSDVSSLRAAVRRANTKGKLTIVLAEGEYLLQRPIGLTKNHITVRSLTGDREQVVLRGQGMSGRLSHIFQISGSDITIADLTAGWVRFHVAQIHAEKDADRVRLHNVRFVDAAEQIVKVSYRKGGPRSDDSVIEWSLFEFSAGHAYQAYTGGIGALGVRNLTIRNNVFRHIRVPPGERAIATAIMVRRDSEGTRIEKNIIVNSDTGIRLGLSDGSHGPGHVVNNVVHAIGDVGIALEHASGVLVAHNTVWAEVYPNAVEYRFEDSLNNRIESNLLRGAVKRRDGASAEVSDNVEFAQADWFVSPASGDLTLSRGHAAVVDRAALSPFVTDDVNCVSRPLGRYPDVGAEEFRGVPVANGGVLGSILERSMGQVWLWHSTLRYGAARLPAPLRPVFSVTVLTVFVVGLLWIVQTRRDARAKRPGEP